MCKLVPYKDGKLVADIKLDYISNIIEQASKAKNISRIMLFGSSTEERCAENSDIDIAVFGQKDSSRYIDSSEFHKFTGALYEFDWNQNYDILYFKDGKEYKDNIMKFIDKGIEIYRRA